MRDRAHQRELVLAGRKRRPAGEDFVEHVAEAMQLRLRRLLETFLTALKLLGQIAAALLGREVRERPEEAALGGHGEARAAAGDAHVEEHGLAVWPHHQVVGLDVAVKDAVPAGLPERARRL